jgi:ectoine hydroxylase-related dioxygenase (phytanoyl-CoA dioxygenase family)
VPGYWKIDHPKKIFNPFLLGGSVIDLLVDEYVIDLVETYMKSQCVLAEANVKVDEPTPYEYFPLHADFDEGWRKSEDIERKLTKEELTLPIGVGGAIYLHDVSEGAFSYCTRTHKLLAPRGADFRNYPADEQANILKSWVRIDGKKGDLILFDDRGFHGPAQPSTARRSVILLDYYRVETFGYFQVSPMPIWSSDIGRLSEKQLRVAGAGAEYWIPPEKYMGTRFGQNPIFKVAVKLVENAYLWPHYKQRLKRLIGFNRH